MADITNPQIQTVRGMAANVFPDDTAYRNFLLATFPSKEWTDPDRPSTKDLTKDEAHVAIQALDKAQRSPEQNRIPTPPPQADQPWKGRYRGHPNKHQAAELTQEQADEIARLEWQLGWFSDPTRIVRFIKRQLGTQMNVGDLTKREATTVITGLREVKTSQAKTGAA